MKHRSAGIPKSAMLRSKVTNGKRIFAIGGDGRSPWTRRWRDLFDAHVSDLGGPEGLSEAEISLCRRVGALEVQLEQMEAGMSEGSADVDLDLYSRTTNTLRRALETIGTKRVAKPVQGLHDYFEISKAPGAAEEAAE